MESPKPCPLDMGQHAGQGEVSTRPPGTNPGVQEAGEGSAKPNPKRRWESGGIPRHPETNPSAWGGHKEVVQDPQDSIMEHKAGKGQCQGSGVQFWYAESGREWYQAPGPESQCVEQEGGGTRALGPNASTLGVEGSGVGPLGPNPYRWGREGVVQSSKAWSSLQTSSAPLI